MKPFDSPAIIGDTHYHASTVSETLGMNKAQEKSRGDKLSDALNNLDESFLIDPSILSLFVGSSDIRRPNYILTALHDGETVHVVKPRDVSEVDDFLFVDTEIDVERLGTEKTNGLNDTYSEPLSIYSLENTAGLSCDESKDIVLLTGSPKNDNFARIQAVKAMIAQHGTDGGLSNSSKDGLMLVEGPVGSGRTLPLETAISNLTEES